MDRNIITPADVGRDEPERPRMPIPTSEGALRWLATVLFLVFAGSFMYAVGVSVGAWLAWFVGLIVFGGLMIALWVRNMRVVERTERAREYQQGAGAFEGAESGQRDGGTSLTVGPGRDDRGTELVAGSWSDEHEDGSPGDTPPWRPPPAYS